MSESNDHRKLVSIALKYVISIVPDRYISLIQADYVEYIRPCKVIGGFIPDIYFWHDDILIIGEAKTEQDFERPHSKSQFSSYFEECNSFSGKALLVISVPWDLVATAKNYFKLLKRKNNSSVKVVIVNEIGSAFEV